MQPDVVGVQVQRNIKELLSNELNPMLYGALFDQIKLFTDKFFGSKGQVSFYNSRMFVGSVLVKVLDSRLLLLLEAKSNQICI